jgi:hypothetical protein
MAQLIDFSTRGARAALLFLSPADTRRVVGALRTAQEAGLVAPHDLVLIAGTGWGDNTDQVSIRHFMFDFKCNFPTDFNYGFPIDFNYDLSIDFNYYFSIDFNCNFLIDFNCDFSIDFNYSFHLLSIFSHWKPCILSSYLI